MAIRYAVANGNWSSTATWDGGTLPSSTDDVYANNFTVNIDQTVTVNSIKKISNGSPAIAAGGQFNITAAATVTITAGIATTDNVTNSSYLLGVNAGSANVTINANVVAGASTGRVGVQTVGGSGTITINGSLTGGGSSTAYALNVVAPGPAVVVNGAVVGNIGAGVSLAVAATVTVTGNVSGGASTGVGIAQTAGALTVRGDLRPGSNSTGVVAVSSTGGVFRYSGHIYSGGMAASTGPNGYFPITGNWSAISGEEVYLHVYDDGNFPSGNNGTARVLTRYGTDLPVAADVRSGTTYGPSAGLTGTLAVPPAASVASGVPVDATTGTAAVKLSDVAAVTGAQIAAATSG